MVHKRPGHVSSNSSSESARSKHFLRRYGVLKRRIEDGEVILKHVPDTQMPADFLTKWIPAAKLEQSLRYACNSHERRGLSLPKEV